ncbi:het domain protein [Diplodia corticola]|uniref:Het domain protein n=1 Tax=Diplodia corticola TaxID=236234 RepID=A0A1J9RG54_9PEZI|nr:het domain protein [Diplodia corticola]OJD40510.1 het domain protein [Diplodia corticola]
MDAIRRLLTFNQNLPEQYYAHRPLPDHHIRLVHILPSQRRDAPVACRISVHPEERCPEYEALSYTWGDLQDGTQTITVDGLPFVVRSNLWLFLIQLRDPYITRVVWTDALCINQDDIDERNHQVGLMSCIYRSATRTLIWLGPAGQRSDIVMKAMSIIHKVTLVHQELLDRVTELGDGGPLPWQQKESIQNHFTEVRRWYHVQLQILESPFASSTYITGPQKPSLIPGVEETISTKTFRLSLRKLYDNVQDEMIRLHPADDWRLKYREKFMEHLERLFCKALGKCDFLSIALCHLVKRQYWKRVWIIQEIVLSPHIEIFCGAKTAPWDGFRYLLRSCDIRATHGHALQVAASMATPLNREWEMRHDTALPTVVEIPRGFEGLESVLDQFEASTCTDVRDKVYGLLGLVVTSLEADYYRTPVQLFAYLMALFASDLSQKDAYGQERPISKLLHFGKLLARTLKLDVNGLKGSQSTDAYGTILKTSGAICGRVLLSGSDIQNSEETETKFLDNLMAHVPAGASKTHGACFRASASERVQRLKKLIPLLLAESACSIDYTQFRGDVGDPEAAVTPISLSYSPTDHSEPPAWNNPATGELREIHWFAYSHDGCVGLSDVDVQEDDLICSCGSIGPMHAFVLRESVSGYQIVGRAILSGTSYIKHRSLFNAEGRFGQNEIKFPSLEVSFDAISLLAFVLFPFP